MELNIQAIADEKIQAMHESGELHRRIEEGISKLILGAIDSALGGYEIKRSIEKLVSENVSHVAASLGFSAYNSVIANTMKGIVEGAMQEDVAKKIQKVFDGMLVARHDGMKLSEILLQYRAYLMDRIDDEDKHAFENFTCVVDREEDGSFTWYKVRLSPERTGSSNDAEILFSFFVYQNAEKAKISSLRFDGTAVNGKIPLGCMNPIETLLANLYFNETEIIIDFEASDIDDRYDVDC